MAKVRLSEKSRVALSIATIIIAYIVGMATGVMLDAITPINLHPDYIVHPHNKRSDANQNCEKESTDSETTAK